MILDPLKQLVRIHEEQKRLKAEYLHYMEIAVMTGYSNVKIARELGLSEAAVRMYRKRNGEF